MVVLFLFSSLNEVMVERSSAMKGEVDSKQRTSDRRVWGREIPLIATERFEGQLNCRYSIGVRSGHIEYSITSEAYVSEWYSMEI